VSDICFNPYMSAYVFQVLSISLILTFEDFFFT